VNCLKTDRFLDKHVALVVRVVYEFSGKLQKRSKGSCHIFTDETCCCPSLTNKPTSVMLKAMKTPLGKPLAILIAITCLVITSYFIMLIYKELKPKTLNEQKMHCLELGSNARAQACMRLLDQPGE